MQCAGPSERETVRLLLVGTDSSRMSRQEKIEKSRPFGVICFEKLLRFWAMQKSDDRTFEHKWVWPELNFCCAECHLISSKKWPLSKLKNMNLTFGPRFRRKVLIVVQ